jgi:hypothetical protein
MMEINVQMIHVTRELTPVNIRQFLTVPHVMITMNAQSMIIVRQECVPEILIQLILTGMEPPTVLITVLVLITQARQMAMVMDVVPNVTAMIRIWTIGYHAVVV